MRYMKQRNAILSLVVAGAIWGSTVALSKLSLGWLDASWLTVLRFGAAAPVLALFGRRHLRGAVNPRVLIAGAAGYGITMLLQNAGIEHTSVSHAAIIVGGVPVIVAVVSAGLGHGRSSRVAWVGYGVALLGIVFVAKGGGGGATSHGDLLVLGSVVMSAGLIAVQPRLLEGQDAAAVTAVQFTAASIVALPVALLSGGLPHAPSSAAPVIAFVALALLGTVVPFWLFAHGQKGTSPQFAGAMVNIEPLVGAVVGWVAFADPVGVWQIVGAAAVVLGILLSTVPWDRITLDGLPQRLHARFELP
jgi:drug/metabolite transporter (DMT)-like permease